MYAQMLGPGDVADLNPPSPDGVQVLYSDEYVAERMRKRSIRAHAQRGKVDLHRRNVYEYTTSNPITHRDPSGLDRRIWSGIIGHCYLEVDTYDENRNPTGETVDLHFSPGWLPDSVGGYTIQSPHLSLGAVIWERESSCEEDRQLLEKWRQLEKERRDGTLYRRYCVPCNCCWTPVWAYRNEGIRTWTDFLLGVCLRAADPDLSCRWLIPLENLPQQ